MDTLVEMWEHDYDEDKELQSWLSTSNFKYVTRLNPRDAFTGGRVNAARLYYKCKTGEYIRYVDFTSLYPYINKYGIYPVGHPKILRDFTTTSIVGYQGIIKCSAASKRAVPPCSRSQRRKPVTMVSKWWTSWIFWIVYPHSRASASSRCVNTPVIHRSLSVWLQVVHLVFMQAEHKPNISLHMVHQSMVRDQAGSIPCRCHYRPTEGCLHCGSVGP
eukprot:Lithocolla_globosa_v1_NODE_115_length_6172_cov_14.462155.p2 type:complete len:217 gc:universal NODE_115_length_6172_cov_14.462155:4423-3773(-)